MAAVTISTATLPSQPQAGSRQVRALVIITAVMGLEAFAVATDGAFFLGSMTLCVIGFWVLAIAAVLNEEKLGLRSLYIALPTALLTALWLWTGLSILWSITPNGSWDEFNRTSGYLAVFIIGLSVGRYPRVRQLTVYLFLLIAAAAAVYALGTKAAPSLVENINNLGRVSVPIGYANGIGLMMALPVPLALYVATTKGIHAVLRVLAAVIMFLLLMALFFTLSRGATLALLVGLVVYFIASRARLMGFFTLALVLAPVVAIATWSNAQPALMKTGIDLEEKLMPAASLRLYLITALVAVAFIYALALFVGGKVTIPERASELTGTAVLAVLTAFLITGAILFFSTNPSVKDWAGQQYEEFSTKPSNVTGADRLLMTNSRARYQIWKESLASFKEKPVIGSGAQSFSIIHKMTKEDWVGFLKDPHSLFIRWLTDLGLIGFFLGLAFVVSMLTGTIMLLRKTTDRLQRSLIVSFLSLSVVYLVGTSFDWDWNIIALTMLYFLFAGMAMKWVSQIQELKEDN